MTQKQKAVAVTVCAVVAVAVAGFYVFRDSPPEPQPNGVILQKQDIPARVVAFGGFVVAVAKIVWDVWAALERVVCKAVQKKVFHYGTRFAVEVYNPSKDKINISCVRLVVKLAEQAAPQELDMKTGEDAKATSRMIEGKETVDFYFVASFAKQNVEYAYVEVETPAGRVAYLNNKTVRPVLLA